MASSDLAEACRRCGACRVCQRPCCQRPCCQRPCCDPGCCKSNPELDFAIGRQMRGSISYCCAVVGPKNLPPRHICNRPRVTVWPRAAVGSPSCCDPCWRTNPQLDYANCRLGGGGIKCCCDQVGPGNLPPRHICNRMYCPPPRRCGSPRRCGPPRRRCINPCRPRFRCR